MRKLFSLALLLLVFCNGESGPTGSDGPVPFSQVYKNKNSGITRRGAEVVSRQSRWDEVWAEIGATTAKPVVNFEENILIVAALGTTGDACRDMKIEKVDRANGVLTISILEEIPAPNCPTCPPVTIQPVHVVSVPRAASGAGFTWRQMQKACP